MRRYSSSVIPYSSIIPAVLASLLLFSGCTRSNKTARVDYASKSAAIVSSEKAGADPLMTTCPVGMVLIPTGPMLYGPTEERNSTAASKEAPQRISMKAFCIDKYEFPNQPGEAPMRSLNWAESKELCVNKGKRLCSEYEFEKACRGPSATLFTYGDGFAEGACAKADQDYGIGQFTNCISGFGVHDMSGGVFEWTSSGPEGNDGERFVRGGMSPDYSATTARCTYRGRFKATHFSREIGFRCCTSTLKEELQK
ncbi:MAG TPA: SUMF1/EgtB/PvdO family nonheme iron enzyme [Planctomycetota bacterium]|nr:SUMF1/EgtB/PvdO family nonheme iron enzyme [Planctomycetota bacterium]